MQRIRWSAETVVAAVRELRGGRPARDVAARHGIPVETVRNWQRGRVPQSAQRVLDGVPTCASCGAVAHDPELLPTADYAYVLGLYLGDGHLSRASRTWSLRVSLDVRYPSIVAEARERIAAVYGPGLPARTIPRAGTWVVLTSYGRAWPCLLPHHGPGKKHERPITLLPWQETIVREAPGSFVRALIHTDGWRGENRVTVKGKAYSYPRYQFSSRSDDIRTLFTDALDVLGIAWRPWGRWHVSVARRDAVAALDEHVGPKG